MVRAFFATKMKIKQNQLKLTFPKELQILKVRFHTNCIHETSYVMFLVKQKRISALSTLAATCFKLFFLSCVCYIFYSNLFRFSFLDKLQETLPLQ